MTPRAVDPTALLTQVREYLPEERVALIEFAAEQHDGQTVIAIVRIALAVGCNREPAANFSREELPESSEAWVYAASIHLMLKRLAAA